MYSVVDQVHSKGSRVQVTESNLKCSKVGARVNTSLIHSLFCLPTSERNSGMECGGGGVVMVVVAVVVVTIVMINIQISRT